MGALVRERRGPRGVRDTATEIGISPATLSRVENGKQPDLATFEKLCRWLEISPSDVLGGSGSVPLSGQPAIATAHLKAQRQIRPELAKALGEMILRAQAMLADDSRPGEA
ncbi:MAG: helix-turn-helix domain-containing protein [Dehalococcoidia bacterium]|nr:MAG: helix-turn-helix domain-containing protein [Dehalococcoidia bacterium]